MRTTLKTLLLTILITFGLGVGPAAAQDISVDQLASDGFFFEERQAQNLPAAASASDLSRLGVVTIVLDSGVADFAQARATSILDSLQTTTDQFHTVIVVVDDGTDSGDNGIGIDSIVLTESQQDAILDAMVPRLIANDLADAIEAAESSLPAEFASQTPDIARESGAATSGLEAGALGEDSSVFGSDANDASTSGLEPGALDSEVTGESSSGLDLDEDTTTDTGRSGGGFSFGRIIFWGVIIFIGYKALKWFLGRRRRTNSRTQQVPEGHGQGGPFGQGQSQSSGGLGDVLGGGSRRRGGSVLGSIAGAALPSILGSVLKNRSRGRSSSTGLSRSSSPSSSRRSGGNIFSGGRTRSRRSSGRGRSRSFRRRGSGRKRSF